MVMGAGRNEAPTARSGAASRGPEGGVELDWFDVARPTPLLSERPFGERIQVFFIR